MANVEFAISRSELEAKDQGCELADELLHQHYRRIKGVLFDGCWTTHSWTHDKQYADPRMPFTVVVPVMSPLDHNTIKLVYQQTKQLFKTLGIPKIHARGKTMLLAIGFDTDLKRLQNMTDLS